MAFHRSVVTHLQLGAALPEGLQFLLEIRDLGDALYQEAFRVLVEIQVALVFGDQIRRNLADFIENALDRVFPDVCIRRIARLVLFDIGQVKRWKLPAKIMFEQHHALRIHLNDADQTAFFEKLDGSKNLARSAIF